MASGYLTNGISFLIYAIYAIFFTHMEFLNEVWWAIILSTLVVYLISQFLIGPFTNANSCRKVSVKINEWKSKPFTVEQRTRLLKDVLAVPSHVAVSVFIVEFVSVCLWVLIFFLITLAHPFHNFKLIPSYVIMLISCGIFSSYIAAITGMMRAEVVCSKYTKKITVEKFDDFGFDEKHVKGFSLTKILVFYLIIPICLVTIANVLLTVHERSSINTFDSLFRIICLYVLNAGLIIGSICILFKKIHHFCISAIRRLRDNIDSSTFNEIPTDMANELSYITYLINKNGNMLCQILAKSSDVGTQINSSINDLVEISTENSTSSIQQSTSVRQIVSSMEYVDTLSKNVSSVIDEVNSVVNQNFEYVEQGFAALNENLTKMVDISESNNDTIKGIKELSDQINGIWDVVNIISNIAEQTKIIAFNAELEASSAGEYGKNFHIVANEIRRLAESTSDSTNEIKNSIYSIQHSSDELIISSKGGTFKINEGLKLSEELNKNFESIKNSSNSIQASATEMNSLITKQTSAYSEILETLRQISSGIESNTHSSHTINDYALQLQKIADVLHDLKKFTFENESKKY